MSDTPIASNLDSNTASDLQVKLCGQAERYRERRIVSQLNARGYLSFVTKTSLDDLMYRAFLFHVIVYAWTEPFGGVSHPQVSMTYTRQIRMTGAADDEATSFFPNETEFRSSFDSRGVGGFGNRADTSISPTEVSQTIIADDDPEFPAVRVGQQTFRLSDPIKLRDYQQLMVGNLDKLNFQQLADATLQDTENNWELLAVLDGVQGSLRIDLADSVIRYPFQFASPFYEQLMEDVPNPPMAAGYQYKPYDQNGQLGAFGLIDSQGKILQAQIKSTAAGVSVIDDVLGIEGANYYPGDDLRNRQIALQNDPNNNAGPDFGDLGTFKSFLIWYDTPTYFTTTAMYASKCQHRMRAPICVALKKWGRPRFDAVQNLWLLDGDSEYVGAVPFPTTSSDQIQIETQCPATTIPAFWDAGLGQYAFRYTYQLWGNDPTSRYTNEQIPDSCSV